MEKTITIDGPQMYMQIKRHNPNHPTVVSMIAVITVINNFPKTAK